MTWIPPTTTLRCALAAALTLVATAVAACGDSPAGRASFTERPLPASDAWVPTPSDLTGTPAESAPSRVLLDLDPTSPPAQGTLIGGWSAPPGEFAAARVWSHGERSTLRFELEHATPLWIELSCAPFTHPGSPPQLLAARLGGVELAETPLRDGFHDYRIEVPADAVRSGYNVLEFRYSHVTRPIDVLPDSRDPRPLGVAFRRIALVPRPVARPVDVTLRDGDPPVPGWLQQRAGVSAYLLAVPPAARLEFTGMTLGGASSLPVTARIEVESDAGSQRLWEAQIGAGTSERQSLDLAAFAGRAVRLRFAAERIEADRPFVWLEPTIRTASPAATIGEPAAPGANLVVIVLDAATRSRMGLYGGAGGATPNLDALAKESLVFQRAHSQAAYTLASTASLFTSLHPSRHGVVRKHHKLNAALPTLASALREAGYASAAFSANGFASPAFGMDHGFDSFETVPADLPSANVASPEAVESSFERWLEGFEANRGEPPKPFFAYIHFIQPHEPYDIAPARFYRDLDPDYDGPVDGSTRSMLRIHRDEIDPSDDETERLRRLYEGNLRHADAVVAALIDRLRELGELERTVLVITADHGEALGEIGFFGHNYSMQEEVTAIPLLMRFPRSAGLVGTVEGHAASIDIAPTALAALGVAAPDSFEGRDLLAQRQRPAGARIVFSRSAHDRPAAALWFGDFKYVQDFTRGGRVLRRGPDWDTGPDVLSEHPVTFALLDRARIALERLPGETEAPGEASVSRETREALEALGYVLE